MAWGGLHFILKWPHFKLKVTYHIMKLVLDIVASYRLTNHRGYHYIDKCKSMN